LTQITGLLDFLFAKTIQIIPSVTEKITLGITEFSMYLGLIPDLKTWAL
jgi:hypothetical protein